MKDLEAKGIKPSKISNFKNTVEYDSSTKKKRYSIAVNFYDEDNEKMHYKFSKNEGDEPKTKVYAI